jgi:hypothetical protein
MIHCASGVRLATALAALAAMVALASSAAAQTAGPPHALAKATIDRYERDPQALLSDFSSGGLALSSRVRAFVISEPKAAATLLALAGAANDAQKAAIGAGLAGAAKALALTDRQAAEAIRQQVAQSGIDVLVTAFIAASSPTVTGTGTDAGVDDSATSGGPAATYAPGEAPAGAGSPPVTIFSGSNSSGGGMTAVIQSSVSPSRTSM